MPSVKNFVSYRNGYGRLDMRDFPLDDEDEADDVSVDNSSPRPERRLPAQSQEATEPRIQQDTEDIKAIHSMQIVTKSFRKLVAFYLTNIIVSIVVILLVLGVSIVLGWYSLLQKKPAPVIDKSIKAFNIPNHKASKFQDALEQAIAELHNAWRGRGKRNILDKMTEGYFNEESYWEDKTHREPLQRQKRNSGISNSGRWIDRLTLSRRRYKMELVYLAQGEGDHNIFTRGRLETIHKIEMDIMKQEGFKEFCYINYAKASSDTNLQSVGGCAPINSLLTYFYPSVSKDGKIHYDSLGNQLDDINRTLTFAMTRESFFWYVDDKININNKRSRLLRSEVQFGSPLPGYFSTSDRKDEQYEKYKKFVTSYVDMLEKASTSSVRVLYGGNEIFDYQVDKTFWNDLTLALYSVGFICIFMFVLTSFSVWLTFWGIISILLSFPLAFFFYRVVFDNVRLGILNGVAAFVIIGIGVDDVFVFINTFRQSCYIHNKGERMIHTVWTAGKATFFTSFTTAAAFAANIASSIPAVHDFGLFMSLVVACCWIVVVLMMPPVLNIWHRAFLNCESSCYSCNNKCDCCTQNKTCLKIPLEVSNIHSSAGELVESESSSLTSLTSDVPLLEMDDDASIIEHEGGWPTYLGLLNHSIQGYNLSGRNVDHEEMLLEADDPLLSLEAELVHSVQESKEHESREGFGMTAMLQGIVYHGIARPVIKSRVVMVFVYLIFLAVSIGLLTQLRPATKPPQLFKPETNLQMLADLAANFSDDGIRCDECSGFYKEESRLLPTTTTITSTAVRPTTVKLITNNANTTPSPPGTLSTTTKTTTTTSNKPTTKPPITTSSTSSTTSKSVITTNPTPVSFTTSGKTFIPGITSKPSSTTLSTTTTESNGIPKYQPNSTAISSTISTTTKLTTPATNTPTTTTTEPKTTTKTTTITTKTTTTTTKRTTTAKRRVQPPTPAPQSRGPMLTRASSSAATPESVLPGYDPCSGGKCDKTSTRPNLEIGAAVYVVFGIHGIDRSNISYNHVLTEKGSVLYDESFESSFSLTSVDQKAIRDLCRLCKIIAGRTEMVKVNGSQCIPRGMPDLFASYIRKFEECRNLPGNSYVYGRTLPAKAIAGYTRTSFKWIAFAFESTTFKGQSYFSAYKDYQKWEAFITKLKKENIPEDSPLQSIYQTSKFWKNVMMEIIAVSSAITGLVFSLIICVASVAIFTGHILLLVIVILTILGVIAMVLGVFYLAGWEMGAVEAVSLSILVGSSVDYCVHLVEGFLLAGNNPPKRLLEENDRGKLRRWRTRAAMSHIGVSILSSAITTIVAAIPLTQTIILPFSKFGEIVALNTTVSIFYSLTFCATFLSLFGPACFTNGWRSTLVAFGASLLVILLAVLGLFLSARFLHFHIPGPNGEDLFPVPTDL